jgi:hypothetical protein
LCAAVCNKSWKVLIRGKTVNPGKIGLDELYNLDSVFEIVRQMKYCRAVPEVVKSKREMETPHSIVPLCPFSPIMLSTTLLNFDITEKTI